MDARPAEPAARERSAPAPTPSHVPNGPNCDAQTVRDAVRAESAAEEEEVAMKVPRDLKERDGVRFEHEPICGVAPTRAQARCGTS